jgi:hypothetical protein
MLTIIGPKEISQSVVVTGSIRIRGGNLNNIRCETTSGTERENI